MNEADSAPKEPWVWINSPFIGMSPLAFYGLGFLAFSTGLFLAAMLFLAFGWSEGRRNIGLGAGFLVFFTALAMLFVVGGVKKARWVAAYRERCGVKPWPLWGRKLWLIPFIVWTAVIFTLWTQLAHQSVDLDAEGSGPRSKGLDFVLGNPIPSLASLAGLAFFVWIFGRKTKNNRRWQEEHQPGRPPL